MRRHARNSSALRSSAAKWCFLLTPPDFSETFACAEHPTSVNFHRRVGANTSRREETTMRVRLSVAIAAVCLFAAPGFAQTGKPTDPQIAHIAYTAGQIDITAAKQAIAKSKN